MATVESKNRKLILIRHGERVDQAIGKDWMTKSFLLNEYKRYNVNMLKSLPKRQNINDFSNDCPLTQIGFYQAKLVGEALSDLNSFNIQHVFSSPALRCIQTCDAVLKEAKLSSVPIAIEPGLFEDLMFYEKIPNWMSNEEFESAGFNIKQDYQEIITKDSLVKLQTHYDRIVQIINSILKLVKDKTGDILITAHGGTLDLVIREKNDILKNVSKEEIFEISEFCPYLSLITMEEKYSKENKEIKNWEVIEYPLLNFNHKSKENFTYKNYLEIILERENRLKGNK